MVFCKITKGNHTVQCHFLFSSEVIKAKFKLELKSIPKQYVWYSKLYLCLSSKNRKNWLAALPKALSSNDLGGWIRKTCSWFLTNLFFLSSKTRSVKSVHNIRWFQTSKNKSIYMPESKDIYQLGFSEVAGCLLDFSPSQVQKFFQKQSHLWMFKYLLKADLTEYVTN